MNPLAEKIIARLDEIEARLDALESKPLKSKPFTPPHMEEVYAYFTEHQGSRLQADDFYDFYASKGWIVGRVSMKDWMRAASRWIRASTPQAVPDAVKDKKPADVFAQATDARWKAIQREREEAEERRRTISDEERRAAMREAREAMKGVLLGNER